MRAIPADRVEQRIAEIAGLITDLERERESLSRIVAWAVHVGGSTEPARGDGLLGATDAVMGYVRDHPNLKPAEIARALASKIQTKSDDPARILHNTVRNLRHRGSLREAEGGGLVVSDT